MLVFIVKLSYFKVGAVVAHNQAAFVAEQVAAIIRPNFPYPLLHGLGAQARAFATAKFGAIGAKVAPAFILGDGLATFAAKVFLTVAANRFAVVRALTPGALLLC